MSAPARFFSTLDPRQRRALLALTLGAAALYLFLRWLPTGTNLNHMDFRVEGKGAIEFCDPANPQFIPVVSARSPVQVALRAAPPPAMGRPVEFTLTLRTAGGKPIAPEDLLVAHIRKLHLLIADPTLGDYQHVHPEPGRRAGEWVFALTPRRPGDYRVFADFTPAATARGLYAAADFTVPGDVPNVTRSPNTTYQAAGLNFTLVLPDYFRAGAPAELRFQVERQGANETPVILRPVMGAFAHLVAFDEARSGFAHLHPRETDLAQPLDPLRPELHFQVTIPAAGRYVIWAQVDVGGRELFVPFWVEVLP